MNLYEKLINMRYELQKMNLKKTGKANQKPYYDLSDFLPACTELCKKYNVIPMISFTKDEATMTIYDAEKIDFQPIKFTSPFGSASLKGCHEVQNIGAVETYQRRYLYISAFEIVEHDMIESGYPDNFSPSVTSALDLADLLDKAVADRTLTAQEADDTLTKARTISPEKMENFTIAVKNKLEKQRYINMSQGQ